MGGAFVTKKKVPVQIFCQGGLGLSSQRSGVGWEGLGWGRMGGAGVGWKGVFCFIMLFVSLYRVGKERNVETKPF